MLHKYTGYFIGIIDRSAKTMTMLPSARLYRVGHAWFPIQRILKVIPVIDIGVIPSVETAFPSRSAMLSLL